MALDSDIIRLKCLDLKKLINTVIQKFQIIRFLPFNKLFAISTVSFNFDWGLYLVFLLT